MTEACTCPIGILHRPHPNFLGKFKIPSEVCFIVQRPFIYASHGGELKIYIDGNEIAIYPDGHFVKEKYCPEQIPDGARITFDAVTNNRVGCIQLV